MTREELKLDRWKTITRFSWKYDIARRSLISGMYSEIAAIAIRNPPIDSSDQQLWPRHTNEMIDILSQPKNGHMFTGKTFIHIYLPEY